MSRKSVSLPAKLSRPRLYAPIERERLYTLLDGACAHPIAWIAAPPGAGKTTLVTAYLQARKLPALWYQMDAGDADPAAFLHFARVARGAVHPAPKPPPPTLTPGHLRDLPAFARDYFRAFCAQLPTPF